MSGSASSAVSSRGRPARRRRPATVRDMVLSLGLLMIAVGFVYLLAVPHGHQDPVRPVDYGTDLRVFSSGSPFQVVAPEGLPAYWKVTSFRTNPPAERGKGTASLHMGLVVDRSPRTYAALEESNEPAQAFLAGFGVPAVSGTVQIAGEPWQLRQGGGHVSLSRTAAGRTVLVSDGGGEGGATLGQLRTLAASLQVQAH